MRRPFGYRFQVHQLGLQQNRLEQAVNTLARVRRDVHEQVFATPGFGNDLVLGQLVAYPLRVRVLPIDLVDRDDHRHPCSFRMLDRLYGLRHDAVISGHHEHHDVGRLCTPRAHRCKRGVAGRIQEGDLALFRFHRIGADMLCDPASFAFGDMAAPDEVQQRGLAVIDMAHNGYDRGTRYFVAGNFGLLGKQLLVDVALLDRLRHVPEFLDDKRRGVLVDHLVDGDHGTHIEQDLNDLVALDSQSFGQFRDSDAFRNFDFVHDRRRRLLEAVL